MALFSKHKNSKERNLFSDLAKDKANSKNKDDSQEQAEAVETKIFRNRVIICSIVSLLMVAVLFANLYYLQVISYQDYQTRSNENRIKVMPVVPPRGIIYDRNHVVLAENSPVYHLVLFPNKQFNTEKSIRDLSSLLALDLTETEIKRLLMESRTRKRFTGIELSNFLSEDQISKFAVNSFKYPNAQL